MSNKIHLNKNVYEAKQARDFLDEEFVEFLPLKRNVKEFFDIYTKKFFSILKNTHEFFIESSLNYIKEWTNPKITTINNLEIEIENINYEILSMEKFHPIFPNRIIISPEPSNQYENINFLDIYYMQSGKARRIQGEQKENLYNYIKAKQRSQSTLNSKFIVEIYDSILDGVEKGKPIENENDLNDSFYTLNIYNG